MRIAPLLTVVLLLAPGPGLAQMLCAPLSTTVSIGKVEARPAVKSFNSVLPVSCRNTGTNRAQQTVLVSIDVAKPVMVNRTYDARLPVQVGFRLGGNPPSKSLCREVDLAAGESKVFDLPILLTMGIQSPHHGNYDVAISVSATTIVAGGGGNTPCP
jgi:hypothetical protein